MNIRIATADDIELLMEISAEMLREVNSLPKSYKFSNEFLERSREFFLIADQTSVLSFSSDGNAIGCATICYMELLPTFSHPTGKRSHLMNVYTNCQYRRKGVAMHMIEILIEDAKKRGVTEITLDATKEGRELYKKLGFIDSDECMVLNLAADIFGVSD